MNEEDMRAEQNRLMAEGLPSELDASASTFHECYRSWMAAGFTDRQAIWLVGCMLHGPGDPPSEDDV